MFPDRLSSLIRKLEAGNAVTQQDVDRVANLQILDLAKIGEDFARDYAQREADYTEVMRKSLEGTCQALQ